jgi:glutamyl-tRNA synthetase
MILRIEDTDQKRYVPGSVRALLEGLRWMGIEFDEGPSRQELARIGQDWDGAPEIGGPYGPYIQSLRRDIYKQTAEDLVARGAAYRCDCTPERLEALRKQQAANKQQIGYDRFCRNKKPGEVDPNKPHVIRLKAPLEGMLPFHDMVKGDVVFDLRWVDDAVLLKSDGLPTYHLAVVVDDHEMRITHAIRADEWLPSAPKHVLLYQAFGWEMPEFAHVPDVLAADGRKLSKRHGATSIAEFRNSGFLPEALLNFLAFLGWAPGEGEEQEIFTPQQLAERFSLEHVNKAGAVFSYDKLDWMNGEYIRAMPLDELAERVLPYLSEGLGISEAELRASGKLMPLMPLIRERMKRLTDAAGLCDLFFKDFPPPSASALIGKKMDAASSLVALQRVITVLSSVPEWTEHVMEPPMRALTEELRLKTGQLFGIVRVAVTGRDVAPPLFGTMAVLGHDKVMERLRAAEQQLASVA